MTYQPPQKLHAIAQRAVEILHASPNGRLTRKDFVSLDGELKALYGDVDELADAVTSLGAVMMLLRVQGKAKKIKEAFAGADDLKRLILTTKPRYEAHRDEAVQDSADKARASLAQFGATKDSSRADIFAAMAPAGPSKGPISSGNPSPKA